MKTTLTRIASILAFIIGAMAVFAGAKVLMGNDPGYYVINWLPLYNYTIGILTVFITAVLIFTNSRFAVPAAIGTFSLHALVMIILQTAYRGTVAPDSIQAMTIRLIVWAIILGLMFAQAQAHKVRSGQTSVDTP
ncbi:MAG: hypothetical protein BGO78_02415 [Chloroflexi bacterium 44-23]|nr:MAG: hypothetical protein BGO78_02415 [Chloroflexi bacterium 44-23]